MSKVGVMLTEYQNTSEIFNGGMEKIYHAAGTKPGLEFSKDCTYPRLISTIIPTRCRIIFTIEM